MNAKLTDNIRAAILTVSIKEWKEFFQNAKDNELAALIGTPDSELTTVKYKVMMIDELGNLFTTARQQPITNQTDEQE